MSVDRVRGRYEIRLHDGVWDGTCKAGDGTKMWRKEVVKNVDGAALFFFPSGFRRGVHERFDEV